MQAHAVTVLVLKQLCTVLKYRTVHNFDRGNFDGYRLFKYYTENILMDGYCLSPYTCKCCIVFKKFDRLNFDGLAQKCQKRQNSPCQNFALYSSSPLTHCIHLKNIYICDWACINWAYLHKLHAHIQKMKCFLVTIYDKYIL